MTGKYRAYAEYKSAESKWIDILPSHWDRAPIKYLVATRITDGPHETPEFVDEGVPFLSAEAVKNYKLDFAKKRGCITRSLHETYSKKCLPQIDDVFMVKSGNTTGAIAIVETDEEFNIWSPLALIRANKKKLLPRFVFYSMRADYFKTSVELSWSQGTQPNIGMGVIENLNVPLVPVEEQRNITNFLDHETAKIDTLIEKQQQLIKLLKEKRQAVISHSMTKGFNSDAPMRDSGVAWLGEVPDHWVVCRLKQIIKPGSSISYGIVQPGEPLDEGVPFVQTTNMSKGSFDLDELQRTTTEIARAYPRSTLEGGEVILGIRASIGAAYVVPAKLKGANLSRGVARIVASQKILSEYLVLFFGSGAVENYWGLSKQGSTFSEVSIETVRELSIPVPPIDEQEKICNSVKGQLRKLDDIVEGAIQQTSLLKERRTALISAAVTGKIDVRNWQAPSQTTNQKIAA